MSAQGRVDLADVVKDLKGWGYLIGEFELPNGIDKALHSHRGDSLFEMRIRFRLTRVLCDRCLCMHERCRKNDEGRPFRDSVSQVSVHAALARRAYTTSAKGVN